MMHDVEVSVISTFKTYIEFLYGCPYEFIRDFAEKRDGGCDVRIQRDADSFEVFEYAKSLYIVCVMVNAHFQVDERFVAPGTKAHKSASLAMHDFLEDDRCHGRIDGVCRLHAFDVERPQRLRFDALHVISGTEASEHDGSAFRYMQFTETRRADAEELVDVRIGDESPFGVRHDHDLHGIKSRRHLEYACPERCGIGREIYGVEVEASEAVEAARKRIDRPCRLDARRRLQKYLEGS